MVEPSHFEWGEGDVPAPADGEFLVRNLYLSLDPAMRTWMTAMRSYIPPVELGEVMRGAASPRWSRAGTTDYEPGERVLGMFGWQDYAVSDGGGPIPVNKVPEGVPPTMPLGVLGITSLTAYFGLKEIGKPQEGETVVVSGAAGATGSVAAQLAKLWGCRVIGIAGGAEKCEWLTGRARLRRRDRLQVRGRRRRACASCARRGSTCSSTTSAATILEAALAQPRHARPRRPVRRDRQLQRRRPAPVRATT